MLLLFFYYFINFHKIRSIKAFSLQSHSQFLTTFVKVRTTNYYQEGQVSAKPSLASLAVVREWDSGAGVSRECLGSAASVSRELIGELPSRQYSDRALGKMREDK